MLLGIISMVALCAWLYDRPYFAVRWPADIQKETLGSAVAAEDKLLSKERHFAYGQGFARWKYQADASSETLHRLCGLTAVSRCSFSRSKTPQSGVTSSVSLSGGVITIEEWWS